MKREEKTKEQLVREVTELRHRLARLEEVEAERNRVQEVLLETQLRLHHLLSSSPAVIYTCKPFGDYSITFLSEKFAHDSATETRRPSRSPDFGSTAFTRKTPTASSPSLLVFLSGGMAPTSIVSSTGTGRIGGSTMK